VLNASPARPIPSSLVEASDPLVVNVVEARTYAHAGNDTASTGAADLARVLSGTAVSAVVTAGSAGAYVAASSGSVAHVPAPEAEVVDTTGAGDEFAGTLVTALSRGEALESAVELATHAASRLLGIARHRR
jgi:ribokinase